jgi:hypothetical protein
MVKKSKTNGGTTGLVPLTMVDTCQELDDAIKLKLASRGAPDEKDYWLVERLASHFLTQDEVCSILDISRAKFEGDLRFQQSYQRGFSVGKASLRRMQFQSAKRNPVMQIWLGKQHLDQHDKVETKQGDDRKDAYEGFLNKLQIELNISTTGQPAPKVIGQGTGDSGIHLGIMGKRESVGADTRGVAQQALVEGVTDRLVERPLEPGEDVLGLVEDLAVSSRKRKRENTKRGGVGTKKS